MVKCADKYRAREYVKSKGLGNIINKLYVVYDNPAEINLEVLHNKFVIKTNNGSGTNIFYKDKSQLSLV